MRLSVYPVSRAILRHLTFKLGVSIPPKTRIGSGLYIGHFGGIFVNDQSVIGRDCNLSQGVTIGQANRGRNVGSPVIGDGVYIGPGAKIIGAVKVGNNVAVGANAVVTRDVPDDSVVVGVPAEVISLDGATGYITRIDYDDKIR